MPHLSKQQIEPELLQKLFAELEQLIADTSKRDASLMIDALLTKTERIMLTKRLAAALMFSKGCSQYEIWNTIKISPSTAARAYLSYEQGNYRQLIKIIKKEKNNQIWETLDVILRCGMPPRGKGRWAILNKMS